MCSEWNNFSKHKLQIARAHSADTCSYLICFTQWYYLGGRHLKGADIVSSTICSISHTWEHTPVSKVPRVIPSVSWLCPSGLFGESWLSYSSTLHFQLKASSNMHWSLMFPSIQTPPNVTHTHTQCITLTLTTSAVCKHRGLLTLKYSFADYPPGVKLFASR